MSALVPVTGYLDRRPAPLSLRGLVGDVRTTSYEIKTVHAQRRANAEIDAIVGVGMHSAQRQMELVDEAMYMAGSNLVKQEIALRIVQETSMACTATQRRVLR